MCARMCGMHLRRLQKKKSINASKVHMKSLFGRLEGLIIIFTFKNGGVKEIMPYIYIFFDRILDKYQNK